MTTPREMTPCLAEEPVELAAFNQITAGSALAVGRFQSKNGTSPEDERPVIFDRSTMNESDLRICGPYLHLPEATSFSTAALVPPLYYALRIWDRLELTLGEKAVIAGLNPVTAILAQVAYWYGAATTLVSDRATKIPDHLAGLTLDPDQPEKSEHALMEAVGHCPGVAIAEFSGRAGIIDLLLEVIPFWGRLMFCSPQTELLTIDYYRNLHRSGAVVLPGIIDTRELLSAPTIPEFKEVYQRVLNILFKEDMTDQLLQIQRSLLSES
jgi:hypothetical protein